MAQRLDSFPTSNGASRYPWSEWLDGNPWELRPGDDFAARMSTFRAMAKRQAERRGGRIRTKTLTDGTEGLIVQFLR